jgi:hypothetical protein
MNRSALAFLLSTLFACSVNSTVADDNRTAEQQLASEVGTSCASICSWATQCPAPDCNCVGDQCSCNDRIDPVTCPADCAKSMATYQGHGDACANAGLGILSCFSSATCATIYQRDLCAPTAAAKSSCGLDDSTGASRGPSVGTSSGTAGSASTGGDSSGSGGSGTAGAPVVCDTGYSSGVAGSGNSAGSFVSCEQGFEGCPDGHSYYSVCVVGDHAESVCSCFLDGTLQTSFMPTVQCPALPEVNAGCHWSVRQN